MAEEKSTKTEGPRSFANLIAELTDDEGGSLNTVVSTELHELTRDLHAESRLRDAKVKGEFTLTLTFVVHKGKATITPDVKVKRPKRRRRDFDTWVTAGGNITTEVPRQLKMPLQGIAGGRASDNDTAAPSAAKDV